MDASKVESGLQLFSRLNQRPSIEKLNPVLFNEGGPYPNEWIEITGSPGAGKTLLVTDFLARCLLPVQYNGVNISGRNCGAIIIDTDHHFDLLKLIEIMELYITKCSENSVKLSQKTIEGIIKSSLQNLIVLKCYDSQQLQVTFLNLEKILCENANIGLIVMDSLSAYYWEHRNSHGIISLQSYHTRVFEKLQNSVKNANVVVMFTRANVEIMLDCCWKIILKEFENKFQAHVINKSRVVNKTIPYVIEGTIKFLNK